MGNRLSKIITRTGDDGSTMIGDGSRLMKDDLLIHCLGEVDELNSMIGVVISLVNDADFGHVLLQIQHDLFDLGAELSQPEETLFDEAYVSFLEQHADHYNAPLPPLKEFILPGGSTPVSYLHLARGFCRRVERSLVSLNQEIELNPFSLQYLNRLSDLLFILARYRCHAEGEQEVYWQSQYSRQC